MHLTVLLASLLGLGFALAPPEAAWAHGTAFFELNPAVSLRFLMGTVESPVVQPFEPPTDFLSGVDLWIENTGAPGPATFELAGENGSVIAAAEAMIPTVPRAWGGTRFHVDFGALVRITPGIMYQLRVRSALPGLALYYLERTQLLQHSSSSYELSYAESLAGPLRFGSREEAFTLTFALTELRESVPPVLSGLAAMSDAPGGIILRFHANELIDFRAEFRPEGGGAPIAIPVTNEYRFCREGLASCTLTAQAEPDTLYAYTLFAQDAWGNVAERGGIIRTAAAPPPPPAEPSPSPPPQPPQPVPSPDVEPPRIEAFRLVAAGGERATFAWRTHEAADARLLIRRGGANVTAARDDTFELEHLITTALALAPDTTYEALATSYDPSGNAGTATLTFATAPRIPSPSPPPSPAVPPSGTPPPSATPARSAASPVPAAVSARRSGEEIVIEWHTPPGSEPSGGYRVDVLDDTFALARREALSRDARRFAAALPPGRYTAIVYADKGTAFEKIGAPVTIIAAASPTPSPVTFPPPSPSSLPRRRLLFSIVFAAGIGVLLLLTRTMIRSR